MKTASAFLIALLFVNGTLEAKPRRVLSKTFIAAAAVATAATIADVETTAHCLHMSSCIEGNSIYGRRPSRGQLYAINLPVTGVAVLLAYGLKATGREKTYWIPLAPIATIRGYAAVHNFILTERLQKVCPTGTTCRF